MAASPEDVSIFLKENPQWKIESQKLFREFRFKSFLEALKFMNQIASACEKMNHHPEWFNVYNTLKVWLITHDAGPQGAISEKDFDLAREMNATFSKNF